MVAREIDMSGYVTAVLVTGYDWQGLYLNGELAVEGHKVTAEDVLYALREKRLDSYTVREADSEVIESMGGLPYDLDRVVFYGDQA
jgi:hypothetical protein